MPVVVHLSDLHFGAHREELVESLLASVIADRPDLVVVSGDLTQRARQRQFHQARRFLDRLPPPVLTLAGNHDLPMLVSPKRLIAGSGWYRRAITPVLDPVVSVRGLTAVGLDSMPPWRWKAGHVSPRQAALVRDTFAGLPDGTWRLVATHHPLLPSGLSRFAGRRSLSEACAASNVALLLSGHLHRPSATLVELGATTTRRRALSVVSSTTISRRTRGAPNAYGVLRLPASMTMGGVLAVERRQPDGNAWPVASVEQFDGSELGVTARGQGAQGIGA